MNWGLTQEFYQQVPNAYLDSEAESFPDPKLVYLNESLFSELGLDTRIPESSRAQAFSAQMLPDDAKPIAQAYAGHQFGQFNPQLGDGRAILLGSLTSKNGSPVEIGFKGSGSTQFSRGGDGKAALGPMLREVLISEYMHAVGVPTTRSLAVTTTGEKVYRQGAETGAVLTRTAASHVRIGSFQFFAARDQYDVVEELVDFCIQRHYPELVNSSNKALNLLKAVCRKQAQLVSQWLSLGFIHGVMNTDNMLISGETIDYGPCAFMEAYESMAVFSSIDRNSRYAYGNQRGIAQWNLARFAETLLPLINEDRDTAIEQATNVIKEFSAVFDDIHHITMSDKIGIDSQHENAGDLIKQWLELIECNQVDFTLAHAKLASQQHATTDDFSSLFAEHSEIEQWLTSWRQTCDEQSQERLAKNPQLIPRNHVVEDALHRAELGDLSLFYALLSALQRPFSTPSEAKFILPADKQFTDQFVTFCGT